MGCTYRNIQNIIKKYLKIGLISNNKFPIKIDEIRKEINKYLNKLIKKKGWLEPLDTYIYFNSKFKIIGTLYSINNAKPIQNRNFNKPYKCLNYKNISNNNFKKNY